MIASSENRTRAARVAGEHSTTEPTMLNDLWAIISLFEKMKLRRVKTRGETKVTMWHLKFKHSA